MSAELLREIDRLTRDRDRWEDQARRLRRRYLAGLDAALAILRERPEREHTRHRAA